MPVVHPVTSPDTASDETDSEKREQRLLRQAKDLMYKNWNGDYTIPGPGLYPHHWGWDTPVVASAYSCFDLEKGMQELKHLLDAQWDNGMIPHIVFNKRETSYFPGPEFYDVHRSDDAPEDTETSGMIQAPTQAIGLYYLYKTGCDDSRVCEYVREMYPRVFDFHRFLMTYRDPEESGAVTIYHPWECMDDLPVFDDALARLDTSNVPEYERKDLKFVESPGERPPQEFYDCFIYLLDRMRQRDYDNRKIEEDHPFKFKDLLNTSILHLANCCMIEIGRDLSMDAGYLEQLQQWQNRIQDNFSDNFKPDGGEHYFNYDLVAGEHIQEATIVSLVPLFAGILSPDDAAPLIEAVESFQFCQGQCIVPVIPTTSFAHDDFSMERYWRGPVWAMTTWMIYCGLRNYGRHETAKLIKDNFLLLVDEEGFREYYSPTTGEGKGITDFTWTAAVVVDLIEEQIELPGYDSCT